MKFNVKLLKKVIETEKHLIETEAYTTLVNLLETYSQLDRLVLSTSYVKDNHSKSINIRAKSALNRNRISILRQLAMLDKNMVEVKSNGSEEVSEEIEKENLTIENNESKNNNNEENT